MNIKLLKELYKQAETECGWSEEKFAELIIRECSGFVYNYPEKYLTRNQSAEICMSMEEHFGITE